MKMSLDKIAIIYNTDKSSKVHDYCKYYEPYFRPLKDKKINILEIGVRYGASIRTWLEYFPYAEIYGIDIKQGCKKLERIMDRVHIFIGRQEDQNFLTTSLENIKFDIIIDDGSHYDDHQFITFNTLFDTHLNSKGLYIIEDLCVSSRHADHRATYTKGIKRLLHEYVNLIFEYKLNKIERMDFTRSLCILQKR